MTEYLSPLWFKIKYIGPNILILTILYIVCLLTYWETGVTDSIRIDMASM